MTQPNQTRTGSSQNKGHTRPAAAFIYSGKQRRNRISNVSFRRRHNLRPQSTPPKFSPPLRPLLHPFNQAIHTCFLVSFPAESLAHLLVLTLHLTHNSRVPRRRPPSVLSPRRPLSPQKRLPGPTGPLSHAESARPRYRPSRPLIAGRPDTDTRVWYVDTDTRGASPRTLLSRDTL